MFLCEYGGGRGGGMNVESGGNWRCVMCVCKNI